MGPNPGRPTPQTSAKPPDVTAKLLDAFRLLEASVVRITRSANLTWAMLDRLTKASIDLERAFVSLTQTGKPQPVGQPQNATSTTPAFDRPIPVIVVGPRPLHVSGPTGGNATTPTPTPAPSPAPRPGGGVSQWAAAFGQVELAVHSLIGTLHDSINKLTSGILSLVAAANPSQAQLFSLALHDLHGVLGRILTPVIVRVTAITRALADSLMAMSAPAKEALAALSIGGGLAGAFAMISGAVAGLIRLVGGVPLMIATLAGAFLGLLTQMSGAKEVGDMMRGVFSQVTAMFGMLATAIGPSLIRIAGVVASAVGKVLEAVQPLVAILAGVMEQSLMGIATAFELVVPIIGKVAQVVGWLAKQLLELYNTVREFFGFDRIEFEGQKARENSSVGAGVRQTQVGDVQSFINRSQSAAFAGGAASFETKSIKFMADAQKQRADIFEEIKKLPNTVGKFIVDGLSQLTGGVLNRSDEAKGKTDNYVEGKLYDTGKFIVQGLERIGGVRLF